jgi:myosin-5
MDDTVGHLSKGSRVWYRQDKTSPWLLAELKDVSPANSSVSIQLLQSGKTVSNLQDGKGQLMPANPPVQQTDADLTQLTYLNEPSILDNLMQRYQQDLIYTNAGPVLIAVNPCRDLPLYTEQVQHAYKGECEQQGSS